MAVPSLLRQLGIRYIETALEKAASTTAVRRPYPVIDYEALRELYDEYIASSSKMAADIRPGDAKPPAEVDRQANSLTAIINQLRKADLKTPIEEENAPRVLTPQK